MTTWAVRRPRGQGFRSDWEADELHERMRHAAALVGRGAPVTVVAEEFGVSLDTLRSWLRKVRREANVNKE